MKMRCAPAALCLVLLSSLPAFAQLSPPNNFRTALSGMKT